MLMDSACYCTALRSATRRLSAEYDAALAPFGINIAQFSLLRTIERSEPVSHTDLGDQLELDRSTIGRNVRVLERAGLVNTGRSEADQRETVVTLTRQGRRILKEAAPVWKDCQNTIEKRLSEHKVKDLRMILRVI